MIKKMNIAFIASTLALLSTLYSCKKETTPPTNSELTVGPLELLAGSLDVAEANFKVAINDPAGIADKKRLCYSTTVQSPTINATGNAVGDQVSAVDMGNNLSFIPLTELIMGTTYYVRAAVVTKSGAIVYSKVLTINTKTATAGTLTVAGQPGYDAVTLNATTGSSGTIEGRIYYATFPNPATTGGGRSVLLNAEQVVLKDLTPGTKYYAQIRIQKGPNGVIGSQIEFTTNEYKIGQDYKGGIIFYIDGTKLHGLIAAKEDIGESALDTEPDKKIFPWGLHGTLLNCLSDDGSVNTKAIISTINDVAISNQTAAGQCVQYRPSGSDVFQTEWYLPSIAEWKRLSTLPNIPNIKDDEYWTSSGEYNYRSWRARLTETDPTKKYFLYRRDEKARVRAIHTF